MDLARGGTAAVRNVVVVGVEGVRECSLRAEEGG